MHIICKEKDYYDFVGYGENGSEDITFDRRNMWVIKPATAELYDRDNILRVIHSILYERTRELSETVIGVFIGFSLYIIYLSAELNRETNGILRPFKWDAKLLAKRTCYDIKHPKPIDFVDIDLSVYDNSPFYIKNLKAWEKGYNNRVWELKEKEYKKGNPNNWEIKPLFSNDWESEKFDKKIPILKNTFIPKLISAEECYRNIEEWLISQYNDKDQESEGLTDVDKAVNHGFDKITSFRKM